MQRGVGFFFCRTQKRLKRFAVNLLGIDYGHKRIGLAYADTTLGVAVPIPAAVQPTLEARLAQIADEIKMRRIHKIVVGYPYNMDGSVGDKAREVDGFIAEIEKRFGLPVDRTDERLSSYQAEQDFFAMSSKTKKSVAARQKHRRSGDIDSRACSLFLQEYLETSAK